MKNELEREIQKIKDQMMQKKEPVPKKSTKNTLTRQREQELFSEECKYTESFGRRTFVEKPQEFIRVDKYKKPNENKRITDELNKDSKLELDIENEK